MKYSQLFGISLGLMLGVASASGVEQGASGFTGTQWAHGVFEKEPGVMEGWYDINKKDNTTGAVYDNMCYVASAVNLITWWQNGEYGKKLTSSAPKALNQIWDTYVNAAASVDPEMWQDGGETLSAVNWWISGVYYPDTTKADELARYYEDSDVLGPESELLLTLPHASGYYYDDYGLTQQDLGNFLQSNVWVYGDAFDLDFAEMLEDGVGITLNIESEGNPDSGHAITLWGASYEDGELKSIWLTDSDDFGVSTDPRLFEVEVELVEGENGEIEKILFAEGYYAEGYHITSVHAMDATASANWRLVPEPATATLSLLALAALAARRCRAS